MKDSTRKLLETVQDAHDWSEGQMYGGGGTQMRSTDTCRACSLQMHYFSDSQNGVDGEYTFTAGGDGISLRQAVERGCR